MKTVLIDVDGVLADMLPAWLRLYNEDYGDALSPADITAWDVSLFVKPACGKRIFGYLDQPYLYSRVEPLPGALEGVELLAARHRVVYVTTCTEAMVPGKLEWLGDHGFLDHCAAVVPLVPGRGVRHADKGVVQGDLMLDDYPANLEGFGGVPVLFDAPYNRGASGYQRLGSWADAWILSELLNAP